MEKRYYYLFGLIAFFFALLIDDKLAFFLAENRTEFLTVIFNALTKIGTYIVIPFLLISIFFWRTKNKRLIVPLWISLLVSLAIIYLLKFSIQKPRPEQALGLNSAIKESGYSFPSAHATASFASLPVLNTILSKLSWFWYLLAVLVAFSRIYLGVHYLSDVIAGAFIGYAVADYINSNQGRRLIRKINFLER